MKIERLPKEPNGDIGENIWHLSPAPPVQWNTPLLHFIHEQLTDTCREECACQHHIQPGLVVKIWVFNMDSLCLVLHKTVLTAFRLKGLPDKLSRACFLFYEQQPIQISKQLWENTAREQEYKTFLFPCLS